MKSKWLFYVASMIASASPLMSYATPAEDILTSGIKLFGQQSEDLYIPGALLQTAIQEFSGARNEVVTAHGQTMLSGCRAQSCDEKGAAVVDLKQKQLLGVALIHYHCHIPVVRSEEAKLMVEKKSKVRDVECEKNPVLNIHMVRNSSSASELVSESHALETLEAWAEPLGYSRKNIRIWRKK